MQSIWRECSSWSAAPVTKFRTITTTWNQTSRTSVARVGRIKWPEIKEYTDPLEIPSLHLFSRNNVYWKHCMTSVFPLTKWVLWSAAKSWICISIKPQRMSRKRGLWMKGWKRGGEGLCYTQPRAVSRRRRWWWSREHYRGARTSIKLGRRKRLANGKRGIQCQCLAYKHWQDRIMYIK